MIFFSESSSDEENIKLNIIKRRMLRDRSNIFELPRKEFMKHFRLNKDAFKMVLDSFSPNVRSFGIPPILQLAATLNLLASGGYQVNVGGNNLIGMAQTTVSKVFRNTLKILENSLCSKWIRIKEETFNETRKYFFVKYKVPGVIGIVDGTHIPILKPSSDEHIFFNRKGFHSINAMIVCNHFYEILAVDARYGGAAHDSAVWNDSSVQVYMARKFEEQNFRVLGDSGYPLLPWLLTPYRSATEGSSEMHFNDVHAQARSQVERTIGILKARWRCLSSERKLRFSPERVGSIINVCAALHNICISYNIQIEPLEIQSERENNIVEEDLLHEENQQRIAKLLRDNIKDNL